MPQLGDCCGHCRLKETEPAPGIVCQCGWGTYTIPKEHYSREGSLLELAFHHDTTHPGGELVYKEVP